MAASGVPKEATTDLTRWLKIEDQLYRDMKGLESATQDLERAKIPATVLFLDLEGATRYRQKHGAPKGLAKAHHHNLIVSQSIIRNGGRVVKWIGDGVMGVFYDGHGGGEPHSYRALRTALDAIRNLREYNQTRYGATHEWEEEIHTKVGLAVGHVHFISTAPDATRSGIANQKNNSHDERLFPFRDPIGESVDLAARLQHIATSDVIVVDKATFFGIERADGTAPISLTPKEKIRYCELALQGERTTTYKPRVAAFSRTDSALEFFAVEPVEEKVNLGTFQQRAQDQATQKAKQIVYVSAPVKCNVAGFAEPVEALAVSLDAREAPIRELPYRSPSSGEIRSLLDQAEEAHRHGQTDRAVKLYQEVFHKDHRDFHANARLALHYRSIGKVADAKKHWNLAKESDPTRAIVWALAAATYFEGYLLDQNNREHLGRAIVDFGRARQLAAETFDALLEQYCCLMLALILLERRTEADVARAATMMDEIHQWPPLSEATRVLKGLVEVFFSIATGPPSLEEGKKSLKNVAAVLAHWDGGGQEEIDAPEDRNSVLPGRRRLSVLLGWVAFRLEAKACAALESAHSPSLMPVHSVAVSERAAEESYWATPDVHDQEFRFQFDKSVSAERADDFLRVLADAFSAAGGRLRRARRKEDD